jgi:hypothetical protein
VQVPVDPLALHCMQAPVQAELQQTPSMQKPELQVAFDAHGAPLPAPLEQVPPAQLPAHALAQQMPLTQLPLAHSRQLFCTQSKPGEGLHEAPFGFCATQPTPGAQ